MRRPSALLALATLLAGTGLALAPAYVAGRTPTWTPALAPASAAAPTNATVTISAVGMKASFSPTTIRAGGGGIVTVVNLDVIDHTFTSVAVNDAGQPLFDVRVAAGSSASVPAVGLLANGSYPFFCRFHPTMRGVLVVEDSSGGVEPAPPSFEQPLVVPTVLRGADVRLTMRKAKVRMLPHGPRTAMWTYAGSYPGPTIRRPSGQDTRVTFTNRLPRSAGALTVHLHGDHHAAKDDGQPTARLVEHGASRTYDYPLTFGGRPEPSSFFFYHDHRMDHTSRNNWRGLQGMFVVDDPADGDLRLPTGRRDVPLLLADRSFRADNALTNPFAHGPTMVGHHGQMGWAGAGAPPDDHTVGTRVLVNGRFAPYLRVSATRYRLRLLNASNFSAYNLALSDGRPFVQVGTGDGLLRRPVVRDQILLGPAQRADVLVDFHGETGRPVVLWSRPTTASASGAREAALMQFRVGARAKDRSRLPATLPSPHLAPVPRKVSMTWRFGLGGGRHGTFWSVNGRPFDPSRVEHRARLGTVERWRLRNDSDMTHFIHIHAEQWRTVSRDGKRPPPWERGLEDTWRLEPGEYVDVAARFEDYTGPFMIHCHMLDHEDHGMMARFDVVP